MTDTILKDTSLCAIIRDEMINPAGGIERFVRSIVPHVEQTVILDTGSIDGTREKLEELQKEFPTIQIYDRQFDNYVNSRNISLEKVKTKWALILDADELITKQGFSDLAPILETKQNNAEGFNFTLMSVFPDEKEIISDGLHNPRLFQNKDYLRYSTIHLSVTAEFLKDYRKFKPCFFDTSGKCINLGEEILIHHFLPTREAYHKKGNEWYSTHGGLFTPNFKRSPCTLESFEEWKAFNPKRNNYD